MIRDLGVQRFFLGNFIVACRIFQFERNKYSMKLYKVITKQYLGSPRLLPVNTLEVGGFRCVYKL